MSGETRSNAAGATVGADMMTSMARASIKAIEDWNRELSRFVGYRLEQDMQFQRELAACRMPAEFFETYGRFMTKAMEDYASELQKLQGITADAARTPGTPGWRSD